MWDSFNPHFRKGSDRPGNKPVAVAIPVSIHTSAREVTNRTQEPAKTFRFQSTLPQGKWPGRRSRDPAPTIVSIHTSAREVTNGLATIKVVNALFQSTLPQGKWLKAQIASAGATGFNPHFRKGSDLGWVQDFANKIGFNPHFRKGSDDGDATRALMTQVSIHTSAREVTEPIDNDIARLMFQSTLPQGKWRLMQWAIQTQQPFQSTLPQGKWRAKAVNVQQVLSFNPHFRKGSDSGCDWPCKTVRVSIHTSAREVTLWRRETSQLVRFQSTLPQGKWPVEGVIESQRFLFQSTLPQGKWPVLMCSSTLRFGFNPHFRKGSDGDWSGAWDAVKGFNPHFRKGSDHYSPSFR